MLYLGIGRSLCIKLHSMGVEVYALSRTKATLETLQAECPGIHVIQQDIANWDETRKKIEVLPLISMLVNNAGQFFDLMTPTLTHLVRNHSYIT